MGLTFAFAAWTVAFFQFWENSRPFTGPVDTRACKYGDFMHIKLKKSSGNTKKSSSETVSSIWLIVDFIRMAFPYHRPEQIGWDCGWTRAQAWVFLYFYFFFAVFLFACFILAFFFLLSRTHALFVLACDFMSVVFWCMEKASSACYVQELCMFRNHEKATQRAHKELRVLNGAEKEHSKRPIRKLLRAKI